MEPSFLDMTVKLVLGFFLLFLITRLLGRTTINQLTPFDFVSAIVLSELLGNAVFEANVPIYFVVYTILLWGLLLVIIEKLLLKFKVLRGPMEGKPAIVIRDGKIDRRTLKKNRMNLNQLMSLLRQSETFSIRQVAFAILENNGGISVLKKSPYKEVTQKVMNLEEHPVYLPISVILDGEILDDNLREIGLTRPWLTNELAAQGIYEARHVLYADYLQGDGLYIVEMEGIEEKL
ncbi:DUF421 domain-containing protein [Alteribacter aurantiacus]|uniref:DUF421 domain-containing protein n=1 Tax=Alteribacter aurantiacus TaxID=254410 RepID=UPI0004185409|nr:DUF421 domain-containing protein [Alteribacter aurantiacus]